MSPRLKKLITYLSLLLLGGVFLGPLVTYATLTLDSTSLTSDSTLTLKSASSSVTNIGETNQTGAITVASSSETLTLNLGTGTGAATVNIATGATNAKTVNIATGASLLNTITLGAASTTLSVAASSTFGNSLGLSSLNTNSLIYTNSSGVITALASSTAGKILTASGTAPYFSWETTGSLTNLTLTGPSTNSPIYLNSAGLITALASSTAGKVLMATSTAPYFSWETSSGGITSLGGLTGATQTFATSTGISISSAGTAHTIGVATSTAFTWTGGHTFQASTTLSNLANNGLLYIDAAKNIERLASSTAGKVLTATGTAPYVSWETAASIPSGFVGFFNLASCPTGWTEDTAARGRYIVGLPSGGSLASTTGTALTDKENRAVGQHTHPVTDAGHNHSFVAGVVGSGNYYASRIQITGTEYATQGIQAATTGISVTATGTTAGTNAPYIQYLACSKD